MCFLEVGLAPSALGKTGGAGLAQRAWGLVAAPTVVFVPGAGTGSQEPSVFLRQVV